MPGHHISRDEMSKNVKTLEDLIKTHSVIYLLMDTRESRNLELFFTWLKTISFYINCFIRAPFLININIFSCKRLIFKSYFQIEIFHQGRLRAFKLHTNPNTKFWNIIFAPFFDCISRELSVSPSVQNQKKKQICKKNESKHGASCSKLISQFKDGCQL